MTDTTLWDQIQRAYELRPCFACGKIGPCVHREPAVELAYILAERAKPPARETRQSKAKTA